MTTARRPLTADDDALLAALGRRLEGIDAELPRLPRWRPERVATGQLHVVRGRTRHARRPSERTTTRIRVDVLAAAAVAIAVLATFTLTRDLGVGRPLQPSDPSPPGPAFTARTSGSAAASLSPSVPPSIPAPGRPASRPTPVPIAPGSTTDVLGVEPLGLQAVLSRMSWRCAVLVQVGLEPMSS